MICLVQPSEAGIELHYSLNEIIEHYTREGVSSDYLIQKGISMILQIKDNEWSEASPKRMASGISTINYYTNYVK